MKNKVRIEKVDNYFAANCPFEGDCGRHIKKVTKSWLNYLTKKQIEETISKIKHVETFEQYLIRLEHLPDETEPILYLKPYTVVEPIGYEEIKFLQP